MALKRTLAATAAIASGAFLFVATPAHADPGTKVGTYKSLSTCQHAGATATHYGRYSGYWCRQSRHGYELWIQ